MSDRMPPRILHRLGLRSYLSEPQSLSLSGRSGLRRSVCPGCGRRYAIVTSFVLLGGYAHAIAKTALHDHAGREAFIDAIFGSFTNEAAEVSDDRITFGCRVGPIEGQNESAATAIDAAQPYDTSAVWGQKLSRAEALQHPRVSEFWNLVDFLLVHERPIARHMGHAGPRT